MGAATRFGAAPLPARTLRTRADAEKVELDLKRRKALGEHYEAPSITLGGLWTARLRGSGPTGT
jgi:hypothetical protein